MTEDQMELLLKARQSISAAKILLDNKNCLKFLSLNFCLLPLAYPQQAT